MGTRVRPTKPESLGFVVSSNPPQRFRGLDEFPDSEVRTTRLPRLRRLTRSSNPDKADRSREYRQHLPAMQGLLPVRERRMAQAERDTWGPAKVGKLQRAAGAELRCTSGCVDGGSTRGLYCNRCQHSEARDILRNVHGFCSRRGCGNYSARE